MTEDRLKQLMQDALDEVLSTEEEQDLMAMLDRAPQEAREFDRQRQVDEMLRRPPHERAPRRLAVTIMARLATILEEQQQEQRTEITDAMMETAVQLVTVAALPLLVGAGWMILNAQTDPEVLEAVLQRVALLLILVIESMKVMLEEAHKAFQENPEQGMAMLTLIPITMLALVQEILGKGDDDDGDDDKDA